MIPNTAIVIFATLLVAIEAKSSQDLIGERLKGFHDHFTSQANVIKDAGINTDKIMNALSAQLKSLLQDAIKEMDGMEAENKRLNEKLQNVTTECHKALTQCKSMVEDIGKTAVDLKHQLDAEEKTTASLREQIGKMNQEIKDLKQDTKNCQDANKKLTEKNNALEEDKEKLNMDLAKCKKEKEDIGKQCQDGLLECQSYVKELGEKLVKCHNDLKDCKGYQKTCSECNAKNKELTETLEKRDKQLKESKTENKNLQNERDKCLVDLEVYRGGWEKVSGRYVKHFNDQKVTWSEAKASCEKRNAQLLMVQDAETQEWSKKIHTPVWIGATDQGHEGDWKWVDGSPVDKTKKSKHWGAGEPDSGLGLVEEDCLATGFELLWIHHGQWADEVCNSKFTFACELPKV